MSGTNHNHHDHNGAKHNHHEHSCGCRACSSARESVFLHNEECGCSRCKKYEEEQDGDSQDGHEHGHQHNHGHSHEKDNTSAVQLILSLVFMALGIACMAFDLPGYLTVPIFALSAICAGYKIFIAGIKAAARFKIDETTLLTIAVAAAFCIGEYPEGAVVTILFQIGEILEEKAVAKSRGSIAKLSNIRPDKAVVMENGREITVDADRVAAGTEIIVKPHARIPLDGVVTEGSSSIDSSAITGESLPVAATEGTEVMSGMLNGEGLIKVRTTKELSESTATRILRLVEDAEKSKSSEERFITRFAAVYTPIVLAVSLLIALIPILMGENPEIWIYRSLTCLVASCPCAIVISVPLAFYAGIGKATKYGVLIKGGKYVEAISKADCFAFDKTGTITTGNLAVSKIIARRKDITRDEVLALCAACEENSSHPMAAAIINAAKEKGFFIPELENYREKPGYGVYGEKDGKQLVCGGKRILREDQIPQDKDSKVFLLENGELIGEILLTDEVRSEAKEVIKSLREEGVKTAAMLTGDLQSHAKPIADEVGINMLRSQLLPQEKVGELNRLKERHTCCYVGDGINDAPVMAAADCSFAMGLGSEAAIETADAVLSGGNLSPLPKTKKLCKRVMNTAKGNIVFAIAVKIFVVVMGVLGFAPIWLAVMADTGVSIICIFNSVRLLK